MKKCILVGLALLLLCAGGVAARAQVQPSDPLAARILELQDTYRQVVVDIAALKLQLKQKEELQLRLEGGILELQRLQPVLQEQAQQARIAPSGASEDVITEGQIEE